MLNRSRLILIIIAVSMMTGCALTNAETPSRIALLAPFEGRYREVGYDAFYAAKLAIIEADRSNIELLAVDDGGMVENAASRARALTLDPLVKVVIVIGYDAADINVQTAFSDLPVIIVGNWMTEPQSDNVFILSNPDIELSYDGRLDVTEVALLDTPFICGEICALNGFRALRNEFDDISIISSGNLSDANFRRRIIDNFQFSAEPGLLATLTFDAVNMAIEAADSENVSQTLSEMTYDGITRTISFEDGYWLDGPVNVYVFDDDGELVRE
jgi:ABC-type branched-subunit amino acid transport system substrate-binding protein